MDSRETAQARIAELERALRNEYRKNLYGKVYCQGCQPLSADPPLLFLSWERVKHRKGCLLAREKELFDEVSKGETAPWEDDVLCVALASAEGEAPAKVEVAPKRCPSCYQSELGDWLCPVTCWLSEREKAERGGEPAFRAWRALHSWERERAIKMIEWAAKSWEMTPDDALVNATKRTADIYAAIEALRGIK